MKKVITIVSFIALMFSSSAMAMKGMDHGAHDDTQMEGMDHGDQSMGGTFKHSEMAGDVHTEFQIMDLASMNMKDPDGKTHHVMATFKRNGHMMESVVGKVKLISPSGKEQLASLKDFGSGIFAANFTIDEPGKWGVICLFKDDQGTQNVKFWYQHQSMK